ncbi:hypothetical protein Pelo_15992 [Pelomyxa schiedti]|nr:hypothetical protein Pelo_15992 [Pelomyxa schiedti]
MYHAANSVEIDWLQKAKIIFDVCHNPGPDNELDVVPWPRLCPEPETEPEESRDYTQLEKVKMAILQSFQSTSSMYLPVLSQPAQP